MSLNQPKTIEQWFESASDGSEFIQNYRIFPYSIVGPLRASSPVVFTTNPGCLLSKIKTHAALENIALIGRRGLPGARDLHWLRTLIGQRRLLFLGDMDPVDLLVFAWMREHVNIAIKYIGVNDRIIKKCRVHLPQSFIMACAPSENSAFSFLQLVLPDFPDIVGPKCAELLINGQKIELEAVVSALADSTPLLSSSNWPKV